MGTSLEGRFDSRRDARGNTCWICRNSRAACLLVDVLLADTGREPEMLEVLIGYAELEGSYLLVDHLLADPERELEVILVDIDVPNSRAPHLHLNTSSISHPHIPP